MKRILLLGRQGEDTFCALLEDGLLVEYWQHALSGEADALYLGRVRNLVPRLEAAFVDIGEAKNAFLPMVEKGLPPPKAGQEILVQVARTPGGDKGKRVTRAVSLSGRLLTLLATEPNIYAISGKITDEAERARLQETMRRACPPQVGWILRTAAEHAEETALSCEAGELLEQWEMIQSQAKAAPPPYRLPIIQEDFSDVRDLLTLPLDGIIVETDDLHRAMEEMLDIAKPSLPPQLSLWQQEIGLFAAHGVHRALEQASSRKLWLPCGGQLVFDRCEAMTVVDVNAGKYQGEKGSIEESFTRLNVEAAGEIARQLRLRDIGGIVVVDFVDMRLKVNRDLLWNEMRRVCAADRARPTLVDLSDISLLQLTRKTLHTPLHDITDQKRTSNEERKTY